VILARTILALVAVGGPFAAILPACAQSVFDPAPGTASPLVAEQVAGSPAQLTGCWQTREPVFRRYAVAFCMYQGGSGAYRVVGEGYDCQGRSTWRASDQNRRMVYAMERGSCAPRANWTADRIECHAVAGGQTQAGLACTYHPNAPGYSAERFAAVKR
jgi:hypothetical protein